MRGCIVAVALGLAWVAAFWGPRAASAEPADSVRARAEALFEQGNRLYQAEDYAGARQAYEEILALGVESAAVYFNIGNAAIKSEDVGRAVWAYARGHRLDPGDDDLVTNLAYARALRTDAVPAGTSSRLLDALASVTNRVRAGEALEAAAVLYWILAGVLALALVRRARALRIAASALAVALGLVLLFAGTKHVVADSRTSAVVLPAAVEVKSAPGSDGRTVFTLHAGAEVRLDRTLGGWTEISLGPELKGWIPEEALAVI